MANTEETWDENIARIEKRNRLISKLVLYGSSALLLLGLGGLGGYFLRGREVRETRQEISELETKLEEQEKLAGGFQLEVVDLGEKLYTSNAVADSLSLVNRNLRASYGEANRTNEALREELTFYMTKADSLVSETSRLDALVNSANTENAALQDSVNTLVEQIKVYDVKLQESQDEITNLKLLQGANKLPVIKIPRHFVVSPYYVGYGDSWDNGAGVRVGKSLLRSDKSSLFVYGEKEFFGNRDEAWGLGAGIDYRPSDKIGINVSYGTLGRAIFKDADRIWLGNLNALLHFQPLEVKGFKVNFGGRITEEKAAIVGGFSLGEY